jgi:hypothetical protein
LFSTQEFIDASRDFVCVRIETYENKENEERIRWILNGKYANTAFCIFDPSGQRRLSRSGRSPNQVLAGRNASSDSNGQIIREMDRIASRYRVKNSADDAILQDFLSFGQALNVASADQRLLVFVNADRDELREIKSTLEEVFSDESIIGRFHLDFMGKEDKNWTRSVTGARSKSAINIIRAGKFGLSGKLVERVELDSSAEELKATLLKENEKFSSTEQRKVYADHVMEGKRSGVKYESEIPFGEDRDGDGQIDQKGRRGGGGGNRRGAGAPYRGRRSFGQ